MARAQDESSSLRFGRRESERVIAALLLAVLVHAFVWGVYRGGNKLGLWQKLHAPAWMHTRLDKFGLQPQLARAEPPEPQIFVEVLNPDADAPKETPFYSDKNSRAANPETGNQNVPKLSGTQTETPRTDTTPKLSRQTVSKPAEESENPKDKDKANSAARPSNLHPSLSPSTTITDAASAPETPGDLDARPQTGSQPAQRPRTLRQVLAQRDHLPGPEMKQDGGVPRHSFSPSFDVKSTAFGDYDHALIMAVQQRWDDLLENHRYAQFRNGKVVLRFRLKPDGTVIEMETLENTVGEMLCYLCQESIEEAAPFGKWPSDMVRLFGPNYREITFTFDYY